ncbi:MAG: ABC transporter substrate-binding protein, partial [Acidimicrobiales bacterium]
MHLGQKLRKAVSVGAVGAALMASLAATSVSGASNPRGTLLYAEAPGASPNFIFPYQGCAFASVNNINQFQRLMFRPLYWFG